MGYFGVRKIDEDTLYVTLGATPDDDGVYADSMFFVRRGDDDFEEYEKVAQKVFVPLPES